MKRIAVTGRDGQLARALGALAGPDLAVVHVGRPELDLEQPDTIRPALRAARPDVIVNAAAWTAVDLAESHPDRAALVNAEGARIVARTAGELAVPVIQISTDYVFPGSGTLPHAETEPVGPETVYGATKLAGEMAVAAETADHVILRTAWVYSPDGSNFLRTMLRLAAGRDEVGIVADQFGNPTYAADLAAAVVRVAGNLLRAPASGELRGTFHAAAAGEASWAGFAGAIFEGSAARGGPAARIRPITTSDYPTPARRPANSRLDCSKLAAVHGIRMPDWKDGLGRCLDRLAPFRTEARDVR